MKDRKTYFINVIFPMYCTITDIKHLKPQQKRLLSFDVGDRRIGVAISDATWFIANPLDTLDRQKSWQPSLQKILNQYSVAAFVVGLPLTLEGIEGPQALKVKTFCEKHLFPFQLPILLWDERMSTHGAFHMLSETNLSLKKRRENIDKVAATFILQGLLDCMR